jgi:hypothetical protein
MSMFPTSMNVSAAMQTTARAQPPAASPSGWDSFLSGVGRAASNFALGVSSGLTNYDPRNPFSSMGAGMSGAMSGIYAGMKREEASKNAIAIANTEEQIARSQAERASVMMPAEGPMQGISAGVMPAAPAKPAREPFDFQTGIYPSLVQQEPSTASSKVRNLMLGISR